MKILLVNEYTAIRAGIDITVDSDFDLLQKEGCEVKLFSVSHKEFLNYSVSEKFTIIKSSIFRDYKVKELQHVINSFQPDIVHYHNLYNLMSYPIWNQIEHRGAKTIQHLQNYYPFCLNSFFFMRDKNCELCLERNSFIPGIRHSCYQNSTAKSFLVSLNRLKPSEYIRSSKKIDLFVVPSDYVRLKYIKAGIDENQLTVVKNIPDHNLDLSLEPINNRADYILFLGTVNKMKGADIFCELAGYNPEYKFIMAGEGPLLTRLKNQYKSLKNLEFRGYISGIEKQKTLMSAALLLVPSIWEEPDPLVVHEAQYFGVPVAAFAKGGITESLNTMLGSFIINSRDVKQISRQIREFFNLRRSVLKSEYNISNHRQKLSEERVRQLLNNYNYLVKDHV